MQISSEKMVFILDLIKLYQDVPDILDNCLSRILHSPRILKLGMRNYKLFFGKDYSCFALKHAKNCLLSLYSLLLIFSLMNSGILMGSLVLRPQWT